MEIKTIYIVYYVENDGNRYIETITNNPEEWIKHHNKHREFGAHESLDDFDVVRTRYQKFKK